MATPHSDNLVFQGEKHPLVCQNPRSPEEHCLALIHRKAYEVAAELAAGKVVLDLGCNNGYGTRILAESADRIIGVDVSPSAIATARQGDVLPNVEFHVIEGDRLPFESGMFGCLVSFQVIEHVVDVDAYLREATRVLAPQGTAVFTTPNRHIRLDPGMKPWNRFHVVEYGADDLADVLASYFSDVNIRGLFAVPEIYDIEYARVQRSLRTARSPVHSYLERFARMVLPASALSLARGARAAMTADRENAGGHRVPMAELTTEGLYYQAEDHDSSLDLMAVCRTGGDG
ncbi:MAG: class I SAM-dependent methyltransferase [Kiloniellales bacterium]|jgi:SAM-dependent methyltransferase|nr:class I SAM-dependent methyltransferase [Kiloniellales bacterium]